MAEFTPGDMRRLRNDMVSKQMAIDVAYYKSFGLAFEEVVALMKDVYE
ncbi:hypothetical protein [Cohnella rhizosphaerae]